MFSKLLIIHKFKDDEKEISQWRPKLKTEGLTEAPECKRISLLAFKFVTNFLRLSKYSLSFRILCLQFCVLLSEIGPPLPTQMYEFQTHKTWICYWVRTEISRKNKAWEESQRGLQPILWFLNAPVSASCHNFWRILTLLLSPIWLFGGPGRHF